MRTQGSRKRLFLLTPIPPQPTGTATYIAFFIRDIREIVTGHDVYFVVDDRNYNGILPDKIFNITVLPYSQFDPGREDTLFVFIANNIFHRHCIEELIRNRSDYMYSFIHDPQIFMLVAHLSVTRRSNFSVDSFKASLSGQFGTFALTLTEWFQGQNVPDIAKYLTACQNFTLKNSRAVIVHSFYAALKFQIECALNLDIPKIIVMRHPDADCKTGLEPERSIVSEKTRCIFGSFGWLSKSKRPKLIFSAFENFVDLLDDSDRQNVRLRLVGAPVPDDFDVISEIKTHKYSNLIESHGYVDEDKFVRLMTECSLVINLRFPSCGETSGTLVHAKNFGIPTVVSNYQSFHEENAEFKISIDPKLERHQLVDAFMLVYQNWKQRSVFDKPKEQARKLSTVAAVKIIFSDVQTNS